jgi:hypothetical protein
MADMKQLTNYLDQMIYHASSVVRALKELWLWWILWSYQSDPKEALRSSIKL